MPEMLCLVADVLGFRQIMMNVPEDIRAERVKDWLGLAGMAKEYGLRHTIVSDTVFVAASPDEAGLSTLTTLAAKMLDGGISKALPIRGAIALGSGEYRAEGLWGAVIVDAYSCGQHADWLGVHCSTSVKAELSQNLRQLVTYPTPMKSGPIRMYANVRWNIPPLHQLAEATTSGFLTKPDETLGWSWHRKIESTALFRMYLQLLEALGVNGEKYVGLANPQLLEDFVTNHIANLHDGWRRRIQSI